MVVVSVVDATLVPFMRLAHKDVAAGFVAKYQCSAQHTVPDLAWLEACVSEVPPMHEVFVATDGIFLGLAVVHLSDKRILWLNVNAQQDLHTFGEVAAALCAHIKTKHGIAWGYVEQSGAQDAMTSGDPGFALAGNHMTWKG